MSEDRLIDLETKLAYQESTIEDLNLVVVELQDRVFRLEQISEKLSERLRELKPNDSVGEYSENEIPPHY